MKRRVEEGKRECGNHFTFRKTDGYVKRSSANIPFRDAAEFRITRCALQESDRWPQIHPSYEQMKDSLSSKKKNKIQKEKRNVLI